MKFTVLLLNLLLCISLNAKRDIPSELKKSWKEKTVYFGVNKAWDYLPQEHTTLTYLARDEVFEYEKFSEDKYIEGLKEARTFGLKFAGITDWTINKKELQKIAPNKIVIKLRGHYKTKRGLVHFDEWQLFSGEEYHQVTLIEDKKAYTPLGQKEKNKIFEALLKDTKDIGFESPQSLEGL